MYHATHFVLIHVVCSRLFKPSVISRLQNLFKPHQMANCVLHFPTFTALKVNMVAFNILFPPWTPCTYRGSSDTVMILDVRLDVLKHDIIIEKSGLHTSVLFFYVKWRLFNIVPGSAPSIRAESKCTSNVISFWASVNVCWLNALTIHTNVFSL